MDSAQYDNPGLARLFILPGTKIVQCLPNASKPDYSVRLSMHISDFLQKHLSSKSEPLIVYESELRMHFDAYLHQIWPKGKILIVSNPRTREYAEHTLIPALRSAGTEVLYCLCVKSAGVSFRAQIEESLGDGALENVTGIAVLGSDDLFSAVRELASTLSVACCALLDDFARADAFASCGDLRPFADALFFDLDCIREKYKGDFRDPLQKLEVDICAMRADIAVMRAAGACVNHCVDEALDEAVPPRIIQPGTVCDDDLAQLCEAYAWRSAALRLFGGDTSWQTVLKYSAESQEFQSVLPAVDAGIMAQIFDATLEIEDLEINPEECAAHQPPKDILNRTLQQYLLQDGVKFDWLKTAESNFFDRTSLRIILTELAANWDDLCAKLRPLADILRAVSTQYADDADDDASIKTLWLHAARFAPKYSWLKLFNDMKIVESALYL